jgi:hypothetical protein
MAENNESFKTYLIKHLYEELPDTTQPVFAEVSKVFYEENVGGVLYQFKFEFPSIDDMPLKKGLSGTDIPDIDKIAKDTSIEVQRVFPDGEVIVDFEFSLTGKGGDWETRKSFEKSLTEGKGMKGVLLDYYDTFPVETTLPTTLENDITIPNTLESTDTPTNVVDDLITKNDLSEAIQAIEAKYQALGDKTHGRYVQLLLDELKTKGFDLDNPNNIKRLDNFVSTQEFLDIVTLDELVMSDDMGRLQGTFLDNVSNLDDNLQIIDTPTNVVDDINKIGTLDYPNQWHNTPTVKLVEAIDKNNLNIYVKNSKGEFVKLELDDTARIGENAIQNSPKFDEGKSAVYNAIEELGDVDNPRYKLDLYSSNPDELAKLKNALSNVNLDPFVNPEGTQFQLLSDTPTNVVPDTPGGSLGAAKLNDPLVFDSWIDEYAKTTTSFLDNLPLSTTVKNQFNNLVQGRAKNLATPGGVADAVDVWELGVLGLMITAIAYKEYDEIPTIFKRTATNMFNSMTAPYNIPPVPLEQYDLDYEFIEKVITTGEKVMPTDIIIKKVGEIAKGVGEQGLATGFGYVPTTPKNTDTMETTQKIQPGVQEEKMFEKAKPKKIKSTGGSGAKIL